jgi:hypothetical protein
VTVDQVVRSADQIILRTVAGRPARSWSAGAARSRPAASSSNLRRGDGDDHSRGGMIAASVTVRSSGATNTSRSEIALLSTFGLGVNAGEIFAHSGRPAPVEPRYDPQQ